MIGVIADDLTGAAELGAVGLQYGLRTEIVVPQFDSSPPGAAGPVPVNLAGSTGAGRFDLVCVDTHSRSCAAEEAGRRAAFAANLLGEAGARWIYKKVDSVLRGQVTAEVEAVMKALRMKRAFLVPANPSLGRTIRRGRYYIKGEPIHKTEFARDPEHPRTSSELLKLLGIPQAVPIWLCGPEDSLPARGIVVGSASNTGDLKGWAARGSSRILSAGGAEYFSALLGRAGLSRVPSGPEAAKAAGAATRELFVCGTLSDSARKFVSAARAGGTPVFSLPKELVWGAGFTAAAVESVGHKVAAAARIHPRVILCVGLRVVHDLAIARRLVTHLAQVAAAVLRLNIVGHVYAEGGATAANLAQCMGWERLRVLRELAPGVATLAVGESEALRLTIKPGSYSWPEEIRDPAPPKLSAPDDCPIPAALVLREGGAERNRRLGSLP